MYIYIHFFLYIYIYIYAIMKTVCPPGYRNFYVTNHALGHMMYGCNIAHHVPGEHITFMIAYILRLSCFCEI